MTVARPTLEENLRTLLREFTAGDPMREGVLWTNLSLRELSRRLIDMGTPASRRTIRRLLRRMKIGRRTARKKKTMRLNTSHDTGELCCDSIALWWESEGRAAWPNAKRLLVLCDGGGSNSATQYLFKEDLQRLANQLGIEIRIAHYPPYCSKHNPIEHRVFPHITRACSGVIFHAVETAQQFMERASTITGLKVTVRTLEKVYATGRAYAADFKTNMKIVFDHHLRKWNYTAIPQSQ